MLYGYSECFAHKPAFRGIPFYNSKNFRTQAGSAAQFFRHITGITIGSIAAELATELEKPLRPLIAMVVYGIASLCLTLTTHKFSRMRKFIDGTPTIVMNNGKLYRKNMKKAKLELSDFMVMCRQEGYFNISDIKTAIFEYNGRLTILPKSTKRPLNPEDINIAPEEEEIMTEIIMDGEILHENIKRRGLNLEWLQKELYKNHCKNASGTYLALCDKDNNLMVYKEE